MKTLHVIKQVAVSYLATVLMYRIDFLQSILASLMWSGFSFVSALLITSRTPSVLGLSRSDLLLLAATYGIVVGMHHWLFSRGFTGMAEIIDKGELDGYLLKPFDTLTLLTLRNVSWGSVVRLVGSIFLTGWILHVYRLPITPLSILAFVGLTLFANLLTYSLYTLAATLLIWHPYLSNILDFVGGAVGSARYPLDINRYTPKLMVAFFLPFLMIVNIPTRALIHRLAWNEATLFMAMSLLVWAGSRLFWRWALRSYTGAGA